MTQYVEFTKKIIELYEKGVSLKGIGFELEIESVYAIRKILGENNVNIRGNAGYRENYKMGTKKLEKEIIELYKRGLSLSQVAQKTGYKSPNTIRNILKKYNIETRGKSGYKEPFNEDFFENIDSEEKAYFLGYMMADGNVYERSDSSPCVRIELSNKDRYILEKFQECLDLKDKVKYTRKNCSVLRIHSKKMFDDLNRWGIVPQKTKHETMKKLNFLDKDVIRHFIRGFFDGDGWVTNTTSHGKRKGSRKCIGFCSNKKMLEELMEFLNKKIDTKILKVTERRGCSMILYSSKKDTQALIKYFYENSTIFLTRKFNECNKLYVNTETTISK
ncbi:MAG: LAGLIDADG family homing endonuclease [Clostridium sp.]|uniref:helix-turn-helix transcriptional regulator n=1 Tax=Clostridium sp. TaxID=1506 RepID=UPI003F3FBB45